MLMMNDPKAIVLNLNNPDRVLNVIPSARMFDFQGHDLVAVPHRTDEVSVLNNLGFEADPPILHYYDWPGQYQPYEHQRETSAFLTRHRKCLVLNEIGTGKSMSALWAADYLIREGILKRVLILSPLSTLESVWGDELFFNFIGRTYAILHGSAKKRLELLGEDHQFYIINHDGFGIIKDAAQDMFDLVIIDEAAVYRNTQTTRFRTINKWLRHNPQARVWLMTGTPTPNAPTDAYALGRLIESPYTEIPFTHFRDRTMKKVGQFTWMPRTDSAEIVHLALTPSIRYSRDECFDLPETVVETRQCKLSSEQEKVYNDMLKKFLVQVDGAKLTAANEAIKVNKLLQIACGVAYDDDSEHVVFDSSPRIKLVKDIIHEAGGEKTIVFAPYRGVLAMLTQELEKEWPCTTAIVYGDVPSKVRTEIFRKFQQPDSDARILVAHPGTMAHGLTLTQASTIIWYGPMYSNEIYTQANGRIERIGKTKRSLVVHIEGTALEKKVYSKLQSKQKLQGVLLDLVKDDKTLTKR